MNHYKFEDITLGMTESFSAEITPEKMESFAKLSGDLNPMHIDAAYAQSNGYEGRLVYGMLSASFFSTLAGMYLPGEYCLLLSCGASFPKPVYIGDVLTISGKVSAVNESTRTIEVKSQIVNQNGVRTAKGKLLIGFTK